MAISFNFAFVIQCEKKHPVHSRTQMEKQMLLRRTKDDPRRRQTRANSKRRNCVGDRLVDDNERCCNVIVFPKFQQRSN